jgi:hypothetical protein
VVPSKGDGGTEERNARMPRQATVPIEDAELKMREPAPPEEMERRKRLVAQLRCRMASPVTESDRELWQELAAGLEKERLTFRS